jgi:hypothetical protein
MLFELIITSKLEGMASGRISARRRLRRSALTSIQLQLPVPGTALTLCHAGAAHAHCEDRSR